MIILLSEWGDSFAFVPQATQIIGRANIRAGAVTCHRQVTTELRVSLCMKKCRRGTNRSCIFGPSGETRTPGILLPKQARYQLRYTRLFDCRGFPWQARFLLRFPKFLRCLAADA